MQIIPLSKSPNQQLSVLLDNNQWDITIRDATGAIAVTLVRNGETIVQGARAVAGMRILQALYQEEGNFAIISNNQGVPDYLQFGVTQFLVYISPDELDVSLAPPDDVIPASYFNPIGGLPLRFDPQGYRVLARGAFASTPDAAMPFVGEIAGRGAFASTPDANLAAAGEATAVAAFASAPDATIDAEGEGPQVAFQILVKTDNTGTSDDDQFTLPAIGSYTVNWGDGNTQSLSGSQTHTYSVAGEYVIQVTGALEQISFVGAGDRLKLLEIQNWGNIAWTSMQQAFQGCENMQGTYSDAPDLSGVTTLASMFNNCDTFNHTVNDWDVSTITNFGGMFTDAVAFNQPLNNWDMSAALDLGAMFRGATAFNQDITGWDVSSVTTMVSMFRDAVAFDQDIGGWDVSAVTDMQFMFYGATAFDQDLGGWDVSLVTTFSNFMTLKSSANYSASNLDSIFNNWSLLSVQSSVTAGFGTIQYTSAGITGRTVLTDAPNNWSITDGGVV